MGCISRVIGSRVRSSEMRIRAVMKKTPPEGVSGGEDEGHFLSLFRLNSLWQD